MDHRELALALAADRSLKPLDLRLALALMYFLDYENRLPVSQAEIARQFDFDQSRLNKALKRLCEIGLILDEGTGPGGHKMLRFSAAFVWKGKASGHARAYRADTEVLATKRDALARRRREKLRAIEGGAGE